VLPWTHPSPHAKRSLDQFSRFCRAHDRDTDVHKTLLRLAMGRYIGLKINGCQWRRWPMPERPRAEDGVLGEGETSSLYQLDPEAVAQSVDGWLKRF